VSTQPLIRAMGDSDPPVISAAFTALGWNGKSVAMYEHYLAQQARGLRLAWVAQWDGKFAGYVTLLWTSSYRPFADRQIPEISDLNVLPQFRRRGIGNALLGDGPSSGWRLDEVRLGVVGVIGLVVDELVAGRAVPADLDRGSAGRVTR
jgi:ribosomal protein S18 acetylase RimI-like enzyme